MLWRKSWAWRVRSKPSLYAWRTTLTFYNPVPDFVIQPDLERFPRKDVFRPSTDENPYNAWATRVTVEDTNLAEASTGPLTGKKIVLKDNICLAGVPCDFGTKVFENWVPKTDATVVTRVLEAGGQVSNFPLFHPSMEKPNIL